MNLKTYTPLDLTLPLKRCKIDRYLASPILSLSAVITACMSVSILSVSGMQTAFVTDQTSVDPVFGLPGTIGASFGLRGTFRIPILVTQIGVYDSSGDGLRQAHSIGLWHYRADGSVAQTSAVVPEGKSATLLNDFRYIPIAPLIIQPGEGLILGAYYEATDFDLNSKPVAVTLAPGLAANQLGGLFSPGSSLEKPTLWLSRGEEGLPNYDFYPVNFQFEIIPEPSTLAFFALGLGGVVWGKRLRPRRQSGSL